MKMFDAIYKCRLCGEEFVECSTSGEESNRSFVMQHPAFIPFAFAGPVIEVPKEELENLETEKK